MDNYNDPSKCPICYSNLMPTMSVQNWMGWLEDICTGAECTQCNFNFEWGK